MAVLFCCNDIWLQEKSMFDSIDIQPAAVAMFIWEQQHRWGLSSNNDYILPCSYHKDIRLKLQFKASEDLKQSYMNYM